MNKLTSKYYLVGIKGAGMSALASVLIDLGNVVLGSDINKTFYTDINLSKKEIKVLQFNKDNILKSKEEYIYIISSCYDADNNEEVSIIKEKGYKHYYYSDFIEEFFKGIKIGVSGTHGKTTVSRFLINMFQKKCAIAGDGTGVGEKDYEYFIFEACEYKDNFLKYSYDYLIINNIEFDHPDYFNNLVDVEKSFNKACNNSKYIIAREDLKIKSDKKIYYFGKEKESFCKYDILEENKDGYILKISIDNKEYKVNYHFYGVHMIENLLAALTVYYLNKGDISDIQVVIDKLTLPYRRMEEYYYSDNVIICDYAHHPTEISCIINSVKQKYPNKEIIVIFQPHTYSRTLSLKNKFIESLKKGDIVYIDNTFTSQRERYDRSIENEVIEIFSCFERFNSSVLDKLKEKKDRVILFIGAGDIDKYVSEFAL